MSEVINPDGTTVAIEALYCRWGCLYIYEAESVEEARRFLDNGEDDGYLSSVGVYVEGRPHSCGPWDWKSPVSGGHPGAIRSLETMERMYAEAKARPLR